MEKWAEAMPVLRTSPLFAGIDDRELTGMLTCLDARRETCPKGAFVLRAGDRVEAVGLLLAGSVLVLQEDFWGNRNLIARLMPGQLFAESFACAPGATLSVSALADAPCTVLWLDVRRILTTCPAACAHHSRLIRNLLSDLAGKNLLFNEKLTHMAQRTTREKLLSYLSAQAQKQGGPTFTIPFDRQQLADYLAVERSAMSAELGRLRDEGVLDFTRSRFTLRQPPAGGTA